MEVGGRGRKIFLRDFTYACTRARVHARNVEKSCSTFYS